MNTLENQVPDLPEQNLFLNYAVLRESVSLFGAQAHVPGLEKWGARLGSPELLARAAVANSHGPGLRNFDRVGRRLDAVGFHPYWHEFMSMCFEQGMHNSAWVQPGPGAHVARAAHYLMHGQIEAGSLCPSTMTSAAIPLLAREPWYGDLQPLLASRQYDPADAPLKQKKSMMVGMGMTERQGGSDLRSNTTVARALDDGWFSLHGHKWFLSSPMSDAHLMLARDEGGFSCFYVPRWLDDGRRNPFVIQRLKDKLGNRSNASVEIEFNGLLGLRMGEPGRGIALLVEMASYTRLDCVLGSTALLRQAMVQALHHARHRRAFGKALVDQPLMQQVLADMALECEAATMLALRLASAFDHGDAPREQFLRRLLTPAAKFWVCKRTIQLAAECMEVWGGNGYIEDGPMARLYREAPVNSIWEGSGNVMCLDVLRAARQDPAALAQLIDDLAGAHPDEEALGHMATRLRQWLSTDTLRQQQLARLISRDLVLLVQADLLLRHAPSCLSRAFVDSRLGYADGGVFGAQDLVLSHAGLFERVLPG